MVDDNTYVVLTSDNGFHLGQLGLLRGKGTAYDTDTHVPLLVVGPGVVPGPREAMVSNIDWRRPSRSSPASTRRRTGRASRSCRPSPTRRSRCRTTCSSSTPSRGAARRPTPTAPFTGGGLNVIPSYVAVRSRTALLVRNDLDRRWGRHRYAYEFYDYTRQPWEQTNQYADPAHAAEVATLMAKLDEWDACAHLRRGSDPVPDACRDADPRSHR